MTSMRLLKDEIDNKREVFLNTISCMTAGWIFNSIFLFTHSLVDLIKNGGKLILYGNGGSAADCDHIVGEFRGRFLKNRESISAISLSDSVATITAISNDFDFNSVFKRQLDGIVNINDSIIALSTSGTSENIIGSMVDVIKKYPCINSMIITGDRSFVNPIDGFKYHVKIPCEYSHQNVAIIQECTMFILHSICAMFDNIREYRFLD